MSGNLEFNSNRWARFAHTSTKKLGSIVSRHQVSLLVLLVSCAVGAVGIYVIRDLQAANLEAQVMYTGSVLSVASLTSCAAVWAIQKSKTTSAIQLAKFQMEFVASVSHELRTPLAVLSSAADNIADGLVANQASLKKIGGVLQNPSRRMGALVDEVLLFASTEDRSQCYVLRSIEIAQVIESVLSSTEGPIRDKNFTIDRKIEPELPLVVGDFVGISQCLQNLVDNAIKYGGDERWVAVKAFLSPSSYASSGEVRVTVADRGMGIEASEIKRIFEPFYRSPKVTARQIHGTGLGLSLAQRIAEAMGGRISVVSGMNIGTTFTLHLPITKGGELNSASAGVQRVTLL